MKGATKKRGGDEGGGGGTLHNGNPKRAMEDKSWFENGGKKQLIEPN